MATPDATPELDHITAVAELRERFDAIGVEVEQYERVRTELDLRIAEGKRKRAELAVEIKWLRGDR